MTDNAMVKIKRMTDNTIVKIKGMTMKIYIWVIYIIISCILRSS
jgi:hypothetical protein